MIDIQHSRIFLSEKFELSNMYKVTIFLVLFWNLAEKADCKEKGSLYFF
jgi:hypothetical protein